MRYAIWLPGDNDFLRYCSSGGDGYRQVIEFHSPAEARHTIVAIRRPGEVVDYIGTAR